MNVPRRSRGRSRRPAPARADGNDVWRAGRPLPDVEPVVLPHEPGALLRSLGDPPVVDGSDVAGYFTAVVERAGAVAAALALSAGLLADAED